MSLLVAKFENKGYELRVWQEAGYYAIQIGTSEIVTCSTEAEAMRLTLEFLVKHILEQQPKE